MLTDCHDEDHSVDAVCGVGENREARGRPQEGDSVPEPTNVDARYHVGPRDHEVSGSGGQLGEGEAPNVRDRGEETDLNKGTITIKVCLTRIVRRMTHLVREGHTLGAGPLHSVSKD